MKESIIISAVDCGQLKDGRYLSIFKLRNGKEIMSYYSGPCVPDLRMMADAMELFLTGVSLKDMELFGIGERYLPTREYQWTTA